MKNLKIKDYSRKLLALGLLYLCSYTSQVFAGPLIKHNPPTPGAPGIAEEFNWQNRWGSIHMNTLTDGLMDPGMPATVDSVMPCPSGVICTDTSVHGSAPNKVEVSNSISSANVHNGIKFDIKNSVLNCMAKISPNFPSNNGGWASVFSTFVCPTPDYNPPNYSGKVASLIYSPIWDPRANDERAFSDGTTGCLQQLSNSCADDIHSCRQTTVTDPKKAYFYPVSHVFNASEKQDLINSGQPANKMPKVYYEYTKAESYGSTEKIDIPSTTRPSGDYVFLRIEDKVDGSGAPVLNSAGNPVKVRVYKKVNSKRTALSINATPGDAVKNTSTNYPIRAITTIDPNLARIKSYRLNNIGFTADINGFIIIDPSDFFDLRDYVAGGKYESGYNQKDSNGDPLTYDTCPILGLNSGYGGICDPTGKAGCNLPIYGIGPSTTITSSGESHTYNHFPIKWSGYVKSWKWLTKDQYLGNTQTRKGENGGNLYANEADLNNGPILMTVRAGEYCDIRERYSDKIDLKKRPRLAPDLPCIHYWQYQEIDTGLYSFVNLFMPEFDGGFETKYGYRHLNLFNELETTSADGSVKTIPYMFDSLDIDGDGQTAEQLLPIICDSSAGATCEGSDFIDQSKLTATDQAKNLNFVSFVDPIMAKRKTIKVDEFGAVTIEENQSAMSWTAGEYSNESQLPRSKTGFKTIGNYINTGDDSSGVFLELPPGKVIAMRLPDDSKIQDAPTEGEESKVNEARRKMNSTRCSIAINKSLNPTDGSYFIPTNTHRELASFVNGKVDKIELRDCIGKFETYEQRKDVGDPVTNPNGTETWFGQTSCQQLTSKPSCNQTKIITAERYCMLEDGKNGDCTECLKVADPDQGIDFTLAAVAPMGNGQILSSPSVGSKSRCFFSAACFNQSSTGCPSAATSGGHVFCLSADTKIKMANGKEKEISKVGPGEEVMAFSAKSSKKNGLITSKVVATAITDDQRYITLTTEDAKKHISSIRITPEHKVVLSTGRGVMVQDLRIGIDILDSEGKRVTVKSMEESDKNIKVYNLVLEDKADGYIAGGLRVMSYPLVDGIKAGMKIK